MSKLFIVTAVEPGGYDSWDVSYHLTRKGRFCYQLTISELDLRESLSILDALQRKFNLVFVVEYGVY